MQSPSWQHEAHLLLCTATESEAAPFKRLLNLKRVFSFRYCPLYWNKSATLFVTGIGKTRAAATVGAVVAQLPHPSQVLLANFGVAGAHTKQALGHCFLADCVRDVSAKAEFIPDHILAPPFELRTFETHDRPVADPAALNHPDSIVDMESSGICAAAHGRLPPESLLLGRVVSDLLEPHILSAQYIEDTCAKSAADFLRWAAIVTAAKCSQWSLRVHEFKLLEECFLSGSSQDHVLFLRSCLAFAHGSVEFREHACAVLNERRQTVASLHALFNEVMAPHEQYNRTSSTNGAHTEIEHGTR